MELSWFKLLYIYQMSWHMWRLEKTGVSEWYRPCFMSKYCVKDGNKRRKRITKERRFNYWLKWAETARIPLRFLFTLFNQKLKVLTPNLTAPIYERIFSFLPFSICFSNLLSLAKCFVHHDSQYWCFQRNKSDIIIIVIIINEDDTKMKPKPLT